MSAARSFARLRAGAPKRAQRGVVLVVTLILLLVAMLIGLAASRGTLLQERMSANMYDRALAFQRAEAALRAAEAAITSEAKIENLGGVDCSPESGNLCPVVPANTFTATDANWIDVSSQFDINAKTTPGTPQYEIQFMGTGRADSDLGLTENADYGNYGSGYPPDDVAYYRVTARSSNPQNLDNRSIVVLQSTVKRPY